MWFNSKEQNPEIGSIVLAYAPDFTSYQYVVCEYDGEYCTETHGDISQYVDKWMYVEDLT